MASLLPLPISVADFRKHILGPGLALLPASYDTTAARVIITAICLQESGLAHRVQVGGPAHGLAQFERGGGCAGVLAHPSTYRLSRIVCAGEGIHADATAVYDALPTNDLLAVAFARLLLFTDPAPLPNVGDVDGAWAYYNRLWRPGVPHPKAWPGNYGRAIAR